MHAGVLLLAVNPPPPWILVAYWLPWQLAWPPAWPPASSPACLFSLPVSLSPRSACQGPSAQPGSRGCHWRTTTTHLQSLAAMCFAWCSPPPTVPSACFWVAGLAWCSPPPTVPSACFWVAGPCNPRSGWSIAQKTPKGLTLSSKFVVQSGRTQETPTAWVVLDLLAYSSMAPEVHTTRTLRCAMGNSQPCMEDAR